MEWSMSVEASHDAQAERLARALEYYGWEFVEFDRPDVAL